MMNAMNYQYITISEPRPLICQIVLSRANAANALNKAMAEELAEATKKAGEDNNVRVIILTGAGERAFCAGADLKERKGMDKKQWLDQHHAFEAALNAILHCKKPILCAMNGAAFGGGLELAMACDFIYTSDHARMGLTEATLGIMPGMGGTQNLPRAIGMRAAKEMLFTGTPIDAQKAYELGLVNRVCSAQELLPEAIKTAEIIAGNAPLSIKQIKQAVQKGSALPLADALKVELVHYNTLLETADRTEGINAYNEKRKPDFKGG